MCHNVFFCAFNINQKYALLKNKGEKQKMNENTDNKKRVTTVGIIALCLAFCILLALVVIACQLSFMNTTRLVDLASDDECCCPCHYDCDDCRYGCCENSATAEDALMTEGYWDEQALASLTQAIAGEEEELVPAAYAGFSHGGFVRRLCKKAHAGTGQRRLSKPDSGWRHIFSRNIYH